MSLRRITSREYKVMLDHRLFADRRVGLRELQQVLENLLECHDLKLQGVFGNSEKRKIAFLDTPSGLLRRSQLILRHRRDRGSEGTGDFTLKCRSEDRYFAAGIDLQPLEGVPWKSKFEEDIAPPFSSRYSQSVTVSDRRVRKPNRLSQMAAIFPALGCLKDSDLRTDGDMTLTVVRDFRPRERVYRGLKFWLSDTLPATVALILWGITWKSPALCAELSFRFGDPKEHYAFPVVTSAHALFTSLQTQPCCRPNSPTKTQLAYGETT
ncbi:MAG: hypothetical protein WCK86_18410 [Planctomycetia bacterium]